MPYCAQTFAIIKNTEKYRTQMCELNRKSYNKLKNERKEDYLKKLILKQARYFIKTKNGDEIENGLSRVLEKQGEARYSSLLNQLKMLGHNCATIPVGPVA
jgi:hypothetical protein